MHRSAWSKGVARYSRRPGTRRRSNRARCQHPCRRRCCCRSGRKSLRSLDSRPPRRKQGRSRAALDSEDIHPSRVRDMPLRMHCAIRSDLRCHHSLHRSAESTRRARARRPTRESLRRTDPPRTAECIRGHHHPRSARHRRTTTHPQRGSHRGSRLAAHRAGSRPRSVQGPRRAARHRAQNSRHRAQKRWCHRRRPRRTVRAGSGTEE